MAGILGESPANVQQAIHGIIPTILAGVILKTDSGDAQDTLNLATAAARIDIPFNLNSLAGGTGNSKGMDFLKNIFGEKTSVLSDAIAEYAGISSQSASSLLSTSAPAALGVLGNHILSSNMNASGLRSFLNSQKKKVLNVLPAGIFLNGIMGIDDLTGIAEKFSGTTIPEKKKKSVLKWVIPIILILISRCGGLVFYEQTSSYREYSTAGNGYGCYCKGYSQTRIWLVKIRICCKTSGRGNIEWQKRRH